MEIVCITAEEAVERIAETLLRNYPETVFAVRLEEPVIEQGDICGIDVVWVDGPKRDKVEDLLDGFQSINWDPRTGELGGRVHYAVSEAGALIQIIYNIDYIFCDGPTEAQLQ